MTQNPMAIKPRPARVWSRIDSNMRILYHSARVLSSIKWYFFLITIPHVSGLAIRFSDRYHSNFDT